MLAGSQLAAWLAGCLAVWLAGWFVGWFVIRQLADYNCDSLVCLGGSLF